MTKFEFASANRIVFGKGAVRELEQFVKIGSRALLLHGSDAANSGLVRDILLGMQCTVQDIEVLHEPTLELIEESVEQARGFKADWVISVGGGSAIDAGKATAGLCANPGKVLEYLEVVGKGRPLQIPGVPMIAIPTTAGTGSEVTKNAVIALRDQKIKVSLRSPLLLPRIALVDPELTMSMPPALTASTGMDALTQVLEPYVSSRANPLTDALCVEGLKRAARALEKAYKDGNDPEAREDMALVSLMGGLALANAGLGTVHGFAAAIGGRFEAPHGAICAKLLPGVVKANVEAMRMREPTNPSLARYVTVSRLVTNYEMATVEDGLLWLEKLLDAVKIPALRNYGVLEKDIPYLVSNTAAASSTKANPIRLSEAELTEILTAAR
jgi:alcohol dehydrogenase class IV